MPSHGNRFGVLRGRGQAHHDGLRNRPLGKIVAERLSDRRSMLVGSGGISPSGGFSGVIGGIGIGNADAGLLVVDVDDRNLVLLLIEGEMQALDVGVGVHVGAQRRLHRADLDLRSPIGLADAGHRSGIDVEDVADLLRQVADVFQVGALLAGNLVDGDRHTIRMLGMISGMTPKIAYFSSSSATRASAGQAGKGKPLQFDWFISAVRSLPVIVSVELEPLSPGEICCW